MVKIKNAQQTVFSWFFSSVIRGKVSSWWEWQNWFCILNLVASGIKYPENEQKAKERKGHGKIQTSWHKTKLGLFEFPWKRIQIINSELIAPSAREKQTQTSNIFFYFKSKGKTENLKRFDWKKANCHKFNKHFVVSSFWTSQKTSSCFIFCNNHWNEKRAFLVRLLVNFSKILKSGWKKIFRH